MIQMSMNRDLYHDSWVLLHLIQNPSHCFTCESWKEREQHFLLFCSLMSTDFFAEEKVCCIMCPRRSGHGRFICNTEDTSSKATCQFPHLAFSQRVANKLGHRCSNNTKQFQLYISITDCVLG